MKKINHIRHITHINISNLIKKQVPFLGYAQF